MSARNLVLAVTLTLMPSAVLAYPLDGDEASGIRRLAGYRLANSNPPGGRVASASIELHLQAQPDVEFDERPQDPVLKRALESIFAARDPSYGLVIVDFTDPSDIRWAALRPGVRQNVGSVGKILCMLALFDALAEAFPDVAERARILRSAEIRAGDWVVGDHHEVPRFDPASGVNAFGVLRESDVFRLSEWVDHAVSVSANGAGNVIWREAMLLKRFGDRYPLTWDQTEAFFATTPKPELAELARAVMVPAIRAAGLDPEQFVQGSFWTGIGKRRVPGGQSYGTPMELARFMLRLEQGRLVDPWSSLEMKKYLYVTKRRYRYIYAPELHTAAVYFKSGSLYQCQPEEGFRCGKYMGNVRNIMNSVTIVETLPGDAAPRRYIVALVSNVLRVNSAWDHSRIGAAVHEMMKTRAAVALDEHASAAELEAIGRSD